MINLTSLNRNEALRYLGIKDGAMPDSLSKMIDLCEQELFACAKPMYLFKEISLPNPVFIKGESVNNHLKNCDIGIIMCATIGINADKLIRKTQVTDMTKAVILDTLANVAVEQIGNKVDELIAEQYYALFPTFRFSPGYGDYPISVQQDYIEYLDAYRKIGLSVSNNYTLIPTKSITAIIGLSKEKVEKHKMGCSVCNMKNTCRYRKVGNHCDI